MRPGCSSLGRGPTLRPDARCRGKCAPALRSLGAAAALLTAVHAWPEDGCADGTFSVVQSPDGRAASVLFDDFSVHAEADMPSMGTGDLSRRCNLSIPVNVPEDGVAVYSADHRGFAQLGAGQSASLVVSHAHAVDATRTLGPFEDDTTFSHLLGTDVAGKLDAEVLLALQVGGNPEPAVVILDSIDFVEVAFTSRTSVRQSVDALARARLAATTHLATNADLLLGFGQRLDDPTGIAAMVATGSMTLGANGRWRSESGLTLLAGASHVRLAPSDTAVRAPAVLALAVRYVDPGEQLLRPFFETGLWGVRDLELRSDRAYLNGSSSNHEDGSTIGAYVRAGALHTPSERSELTLALTMSRDWLHVDGRSEAAAPAGNPFPLTLSGRTSSPRAAKLGLSWSGAVTDRVGYTIAFAGGRTFTDDAALVGNVAWIGEITTRPDDFNFVEYALRLGCRIGRHEAAASTVDVFVLGTRGEGIGAEAQVGVGWRLWL